MHRLTTAATLVTVAVALAGCGGKSTGDKQQSATPLSCLEDAGLSNAETLGKVGDYDVWRANATDPVFFSVDITLYPTAAKARSVVKAADLVIGATAGRYAVIGPSSSTNDGGVVEAVASCLRGGTTAPKSRSSASSKTVTAKKTHAELIAAARARAKAWAKAQAAARARAKARAKAAAAAYAAANRWHQGYDLYSDSVAYKWLSPGSVTCAEYTLYSCWKIEVVARDGCSYLEVDSNEMKGGAIVGQLLANQANVPPDTRVIFELDADAANISEASAPTITCN